MVINELVNDSHAIVLVIVAIKTTTTTTAATSIAIIAAITTTTAFIGKQAISLRIADLKNISIKKIIVNKLVNINISIY